MRPASGSGSVRSSRAAPSLRWTLPAVALMLSGCAALDPAAAPPPVEVPAAWTAPQPAGPAAPSPAWWAAFDDPVLPELLRAAWAASPDRPTAQARVAQARAAAVSAGALLQPRIDAAVQLLRQRAVPQAAPTTSASLGLQATWELDASGGVAAGASAARARLAAAQADAHAARQAVAAEAATQWFSLRACHAVLAQTQADAESRAASARLTELSARAGLTAPADAALARAAAAQARDAARAQSTRCDSAAQGLVVLTGWTLPTLQARLASIDPRAPLPAPRVTRVDTLPAALLLQRPDLQASGALVLAAAGDRGAAEAARLPRISLTGLLSTARVGGAGLDARGAVWNLGPLQVSLPVFDGGALGAQAEAARLAYDAAVARYHAAVRQAVAEVEQALLALDGTAARADDARTAVEAFGDVVTATEARARSGLASAFELEDARRSALAAQGLQTALALERALAWVNLARALGGTWDAALEPAASSALRDRPAARSPS